MNGEHLGGLDLNLVPVLEALFETPSTVEVARRLGVTQSAVSHALARLRAALGDPLFVRVGRSLAPTRRAEALREPLGAWRRATDALLRAGEPLDFAKLRRTFHLSATDAAELLVLPGLVHRLARDAPEVRLELTSKGDAIERAVQAGEVDLAFGFAMRDVDGVLAQTLFVDRMACVVASPLRSFSLGAYLARHHVVVAPRGLPGAVVDRVLQKAGHARRVAVRTGSFLVAADLVREGLVLTVPSRFAAAVASARGLHVVPAPVNIERMAFRMIFPTVARDDPAHRWLRAAAAEAVRAGAPRGRQRARRSAAEAIEG